MGPARGASGWSCPPFSASLVPFADVHFDCRLPNPASPIYHWLMLRRYDLATFLYGLATVFFAIAQLCAIGVFIATVS